MRIEGVSCVVVSLATVCDVGFDAGDEGGGADLGSCGVDWTFCFRSFEMC